MLIRHSFLGSHPPVALSSGATLFVIASAIALAAGIGSLVWADPNTKMYRMHRLVQELGRGMIAQTAHPDSVVYNAMKKLDAKS